MTKVFLDDVWQDYDYNLLYTTRGYTATKSTTVVYYDDNIELLEAWTNSGYTWIEKDHQWYLNREVPYYINTNTNKDLYRIQEIKSYPIYTKNGEQYLVDGDHFTTVQELYNTQGITETESQAITVYNDDMESLLAWYNSGNIWINQDHQWYPNNSVPYYVETNVNQYLYRINVLKSYRIYNKNGSQYLIDNNHFTTVQELHDTLGYTTTASVVWRTEDGVPWSWYNEADNLYWNDRTKEWVVDPPDSDQSLGKLAFTSSTFAIQSGPDAIAYVQQLYPDIKVSFPNLYPDFDEP